jgi:hypothetical protein
VTRDNDNNSNNNNDNNTKGTFMLIHTAISGDRNMIKTKTDNTSIYKDLTIDTPRPWNVKTEVMPVEIGATGTISESFRKYPSNIPGRHIKEIQKTVTFRDCGHTRTSENTNRLS